jgi:U3 small nucleolar RNA-associated protein 15
MSQFKQIQILKQPKPGQALSDSALYWKNFDFPTIINEYGGINHIDVSPIKPNYIAATHASRVHIYDSATKTSIKSYSFSENAYSASFRDDGKLICMGFENNHVKIFPLFDEQNNKENIEIEDSEVTSTSGKPKKRPLRRFDDHLG